MAQVVYTNADGVSGSLFEGTRFFLSATVPCKSTIREYIEGNGGTVVPFERDADIRLVDHKRPVTIDDCYSYTYVEHSVRKGAKENLENHRVGVAGPTTRAVGSSARPAKGTRNPFTAEDDRILVAWVANNPQTGGGTAGNAIYQELERQHPQHTYQSWRNRYLKRFRDMDIPVGNPVTVQANAPPTPPEQLEPEVQPRSRPQSSTVPAPVQHAKPTRPLATVPARPQSPSRTPIPQDRVQPRSSTQARVTAAPDPQLASRSIVKELPVPYSIAQAPPLASIELAQPRFRTPPARERKIREEPKIGQNSPSWSLPREQISPVEDDHTLEEEEERGYHAEQQDLEGQSSEYEAADGEGIPQSSQYEIIEHQEGFTFSQEDEECLLQFGRHLYNLDPDKEDAAWQEFAEVLARHHTAQEWKTFWHEAVKPIYLEQKRRRREAGETSSHQDGSSEAEVGHEELRSPSYHPDSPNYDAAMHYEDTTLVNGMVDGRDQYVLDTVESDIQIEDDTGSVTLPIATVDGVMSSPKRKRMVSEDVAPRSSPPGSYYERRVKRQRIDLDSMEGREILSSPGRILINTGHDDDDNDESDDYEGLEEHEDDDENEYVPGTCPSPILSELDEDYQNRIDAQIFGELTSSTRHPSIALEESHKEKTKVTGADAAEVSSDIFLRSIRDESASMMDDDDDEFDDRYERLVGTSSHVGVENDDESDPESPRTPLVEETQPHANVPTIRMHGSSSVSGVARQPLTFDQASSPLTKAQPSTDGLPSHNTTQSRPSTFSGMSSLPNLEPSVQVVAAREFAQSDEQQPDSSLEQAKLPVEVKSSKERPTSYQPQQSSLGPATQRAALTIEQRAENVWIWADGKLDLDFDQDMIFEAIESTNFRVPKIKIAFESLLAGQGLPRDVPGIWTKEDDADRISAHNGRLQRVLQKHGHDDYILRPDVLEEWQKP